MGLLTIIRKNRQKEKEMRILFLGLDNAGKTTILKKLNGEDILSVSPTLGFNIKTFAHGKYALFSLSILASGLVAHRCSHICVALRLIYARIVHRLCDSLLIHDVGDVGGQRTLRPYWRNYFEQTDALVWVVDSGDRMRMQDCKDELHSLLLEDRLAGASLLIFANKQDLPGSMSDSEIRDALDLRSIKSHHWMIWSCSAVTGQNLVKGLDWVVGDVAGRLYYSATASPARAAVAA
ncbi:GTP-binding protein [Mycena kentingensis (nom. inval.)]|nr:GTP-binding protein [Mycena kentingensis (nom. inval.)]